MEERFEFHFPVTSSIQVMVVMHNDDIRNALKITSFKSHIQKIAINFFNALPETNNSNMDNVIPYIPNGNTKRPRRILLDCYNPP
ncbi:uncharacterized protein TNCV_988611 [Trichonephila clavipes]|nr:uncharacterized protein TNCV_988611 [Trichonephila clavipes]